MEEGSDGFCYIRFKVVLLSTADLSTIEDKTIARILIATHLLLRFLWELIESYGDGDKIRAYIEANKEGKEAALGKLWSKLEGMEQEALARGVYDREALAGDFGPNDDRIREMFNEWEATRALLE
jgi:hypothetical protein